MNSSSYAKELEKAEEGIEKSKSRMNLLVLIVTFVVNQWLSKLGRYGKVLCM